MQNLKKYGDVMREKELRQCDNCHTMKQPLVCLRCSDKEKIKSAKDFITNSVWFQIGKECGHFKFFEKEIKELYEKK